MKRALMLVFLCACAPTPVVTGGGTAPDGAAWFAVTEGKELTFYRCQPAGCVAVPRTEAAVLESAWQSESESAVESEGAEEAEDTEEAEGAEDPTGAADESEDESGMPDEERMDLMEGVF